MKKVHNLLHLWMLMVFLLPGLITNAQDLIISGIGDGPLTGGTPKVLELYVVNDIPDLSAYTIKNQTNANTTWGSAYTLSGTATAGDYIYVTITGGTANFNSFFENTLTPLENGVINLNGNDRVGIFDATDNLLDIFGEDGVDGDGTGWDYVDGWAYRTGITAPTSTFTLSDWSFSGINNLEGGLTNATCTSPMPIGTFTLGGGCPASIPFFDGFEADQTDATPLAGCWTQESVSGTATWMANSSLSDYNRTPRTGSFNAYLKYDNQDWMFYALDLTGGISYTVKLYAIQDATSGADLTVAYGVSGDAASMTNTIVPATAITNGSYQEIIGTFTPATTGTYYIGILGELTFSPWYLSIDDFEVYESPTATLSWYNLQHPATATILTDETFEVFAQAWEDGLTNADAGAPGAGIECWIGYSDTDSDPSSWTNWVPAVYNVDDGNNDEFKAELGTFAAGTYYYASRWRLDGGPYTYGGFNGGAWDGTTNVSGVLTVNEPVITYINLPISEDFEAGLGNVILVNGAETNYWMNGPLASQTGDALYVTDDGTANAYTTVSTSVSHAYIPVDFNGITNATLSFDWICNGEGSYTYYDYLRVYLVPDTESIDAGTQISSTYQLGETYNLKTSLQNASITLTSADITQDNMKLVFSWRNDGSSGTQPPASVDNILLEEITCMEPTTIAAGNITATSADITWTASALGETTWNIKVNEATAIVDPTVTDGDIVPNAAVSTTPEYALSLLTPATDYYVYVQSACGSDWVEYMFTTNCDVYTPDYTEDFAAYLPDCWLEADGPVTGPTTYGTSDWVADGFANAGSTGAARMNLFYNVDQEWLISPEFDLSLGGYELNFDVAVTTFSGTSAISMGSDDEVQLLYTLDGTTWNNLETWNSSNNPSNTGDNTTVDITTLTGTNVQFAFWATDGTIDDSEDYNFYLDNFIVRTPPSCPTPTALNESSISSTNATLGWTENGTATSWNIVASTSTFDPTMSTGEFGLIPVSTNPFIIPDGTLTPSTLYYWYVQSDCGGGDLSEWSSAGMFTTECDVVSSYPFFEGFNNTTMPLCWSVLNIDEDAKQFAPSTSYFQEGTHSVAVGYNESGNNDWLISPNFEITGDDLVLEFYARSNSTTYLESFNILASETNNDPASFTNTLESVVNVPNAWTKYSYRLSDFGLNTGDFAYFAIQCVSVNELTFAVDAFSVRALSDANDILTFSLAQQTGTPVVIDDVNHTVEIEVVMGTDLTALSPTITISDYATINPLSGVAQDFTGSDVTPFEYTVTSELGTDQIWQVSVIEATTQSSEKDILTFELAEETGPATIGANTIDIEVAWDSDITNLTPTITVSPLATVSPLSGAVQDFTSPVTYTVTAEDATTKDYIVTVSLGTAPLGANCSNPFLVSIPADLTYEDLSQTNCGLGNVYDDTDMTSDGYDNGEDAVYQITVTADTYVRITMDPQGSTWTSLSIFDDCPSTGNMLDEATGSDVSARIIEIGLVAGTYYAMVDSWPSPYCIPSYNFTIEEICPTPSAIVELNLTQTSSDLQWSAGGFETGWNIKINEATTIDPTTEDGDIVANDAVTPNPEYSVSGLTAETDYYVYVQADCGSDWIEYMFTTPATCPVPTGLMATVLGANDVDLAWNELGTTDWVLEVSTTPLADPSTESGDILDDESVLGATGEYSLTGLDANTTYYWYVQSACGSAWSAQGVFTTDCEYYVAPYIESFDNNTTPDCWTQSAITGGPWAFGQLNSADYGATNAGDHTENGGYFAWVDFSGTDESVILEVNNVDISTLTVPYLSFFYFSHNTDNTVYNTLNVEAWDGSAWQTISAISDDTGDWYEYGYDLSTYTYSTNLVKIRFRAEPGTGGDLFYNDLLLDDISIDEMPTCFTPNTLFADNITSTSAYLNWTEAGTADTWNIKVNKATTIDPTTEDGNILANESTMDNPYTSLAGLDPATTYYFYVQADCGGGDLSEWSSAGMFTTECETFTIPHFEGFEDVDMPICWSILDEDGDSNEWEIGNGDGDPYEGAQTASISFNSSGNDDWLISPQFNISNINTVVDFYAMSRSSYFPEDFNVLISTTGNSTSDFTIVLENVIDHPETWELHSYLLSDYGITVGQDIYVAIQSISVNEWNLYIDAFSIYELPQIADIDINSDAVDVEVCQGTTEADAIAALASQITITDANAGEHVVDLTWTIDSYDESTLATYNATGTFELPAGVIQTDPATDLEVTATVTVIAPVESTFSFATEYCLNSTADALPTTSDNGIEGVWAPSAIVTFAAGTSSYVFTPLTGQCGTSITVPVTINELPVVTCPETVNVAVDEPVTFTGQDPVGGTFSGTGVVGDTFDPNGLANDTYVITYTYTDPVTGCENSCDFNVIVDIDINVENVTVEGIGIYPNPNNGEFVINFNNIEGNVTYQLYDTKGSIIILKDLSANGNTVEEISVDLVPGVYFVKVVTAAQTYVEKLVVE